MASESKEIAYGINRSMVSEPIWVEEQQVEDVIDKEGISHGSADETTCPTELSCDGHRKCRHGTAKVLNVARKVSEDLFKNHKEMVMVHEAKDKV
ncbi:hypothetical protein DKX38_029597 [Salix brachista]|uniref:Uncharacterized protein n=1 Tax=Salix brachista TaxID=2182728 RepID=A0A5N5IZQ1_9ROSI|nr:hypothetical protein DKX38_029597 [Salix brachista]